MKTITSAQFVGFYSYRFEEEDERKRLREVAKQQKNWTALDILNLGELSLDDKLWVVLRPELIEGPILHEFACRCAVWEALYAARYAARYAAEAARNKQVEILIELLEESDAGVGE